MSLAVAECVTFVTKTFSTAVFFTWKGKRPVSTTFKASTLRSFAIGKGEVSRHPGTELGYIILALRDWRLLVLLTVHCITINYHLMQPSAICEAGYLYNMLIGQFASVALFYAVPSSRHFHWQCGCVGERLIDTASLRSLAFTLLRWTHGLLQSFHRHCCGHAYSTS